MLEECGLPYTIKPINIGGGDQLSSSFLKISSNGRMPVIVDLEPMGGGGPITIFESGAIMMHLGEKTRKVLAARSSSQVRGLPVDSLAGGQSRAEIRRAGILSWRACARGDGSGWNPARRIGVVIKSQSRRWGRLCYEKAILRGNKRRAG
jgi:glutathione S-transferase